MPNIFKVNNKDIRTTSGVSIVNYEHFTLYSLDNTSEFEQINAGWA